MNKKIGIGLGIIVIAGIGYFAFMKQTLQVAQETNTPVKTTIAPTQTAIGIQDDTKLSYSGQWQQAEFPKDDVYHHSANIMLPSTWIFQCCGDTDDYSVHFVYPASSEKKLSTSPHVSVYDFVLYGCPDGVYASCGLDQLKRVTPSQFMASLIKHLDKIGTVTDFESLKKTGVVKLANFATDAVAYKGVSRSNQPVDFYLIQSSKGVVGVAFLTSQNFDSKLKTEFLNRLTSN